MRERGQFSENQRMEERTWEKKNEGEGPVLRESENGRKEMGKRKMREGTANLGHIRTE